MIAGVPQRLRSTAENYQHRGPSRWHGGNFEHVQNFRRDTAGWANPQWDRWGTAIIAAAPPWPPWCRTRTAVAPPSPQCLRSTTDVQSRNKVNWRPYGDPVAFLLRIRRCYHLTGPAVLPPTPQSSRKWSPWHRHQTAVVTPWDRHVRRDTAVVPPHREEEKCVTGSGKLWKTTGGVTTVMAVWTKNRSGTAPPVWRGYKRKWSTFGAAHCLALMWLKFVYRGM